ncbi:4Fe-4S binding protein [Dehalococcoidia bacterium]|nr:4Fe-4S binding protein [Dehalococcoidia bacterium]
MPQSAVLKVKDGNLPDTIKDFLKGLLEKNLVEALLVPVELPSGNNVMLTLVTEVEKLEDARPLAPVMPVNAAKIVSTLTKLAPSEKKIGVVLRSCELRALTELVKLKQADLTNLILIGIDCLGTCSVATYGMFCQENASPAEEFLKRVADGDDSLLREACRICEYPAPINSEASDITIGLIGMDWKEGILLQAASPEGERIMESLESGVWSLESPAPSLDSGLSTLDSRLSRGDPSQRETALAALTEERIRQRDLLLQQTEQELKGLDNMLQLLAPCVACHNCRIACPICYCKECLLDSPTMVEFEAEKYVSWAEQKGALRMPADSLLFHLVRLNHMATSCVGCGLCEDACPNGIALMKPFRLVGLRVQRLFDYLPGRSLDDELPLTAYREEEFGELGYK